MRGGTIGDSGCGLVCAAMAVKYITTQDVTPLTVAGAVGTACLTDGVNDMEKFAQWIASTYEPYGITHTGKLYSLQSALAKVDAGAVCFAGVRGTFGDSGIQKPCCHDLAARCKRYVVGARPSKRRQLRASMDA